MDESDRRVHTVEVAHDVVERIPARHGPHSQAAWVRPEPADAVAEEVERQASVLVAPLREERRDLLPADPRSEVEVLAVVEAVAALDGLEQGLVRAGRVDPGRQAEGLLEVIGLAGGEDALPLADPLEPRLARVPDRDVFGLRPGAEGPTEVEEEDVFGVLARPAALPSSGGEVERLDRDPGPTADVFDVDEQRAPPSLGLPRKEADGRCCPTRCRRCSEFRGRTGPGRELGLQRLGRPSTSSLHAKPEPRNATSSTTPRIPSPATAPSRTTSGRTTSHPGPTACARRMAREGGSRPGRPLPCLPFARRPRRAARSRRPRSARRTASPGAGRSPRASRPARRGPRRRRRCGRRARAPRAGRASRRRTSRPSRGARDAAPTSISSRILRSSADSGSSSSSTCGRLTSARASATRCIWPPESSCARRRS